jgi:hypothetical protein
MPRVVPLSRFPLFAVVALAAPLVFGQAKAPAEGEQAISEAERRLFMTPHLKALPVPSALEYTFSRKGSFEKTFEDTVVVGIKASGKAKSVHVEFLSGDRKFALPDVEDAQSNPVILSFLERDIRDMNRITRGPINYFRQRVRMALAEEAKLQQVTVNYGGKDIKATEIMLTPYENDPRRARFDRFSNKTYIFTVSEQVPGGVYQMRTILNERQDKAKPGESSVSPMIAETLTFAGVKK